MQEENIDSDKIKQNGWKQGAILPIMKEIKADVTIQNSKELLCEGLYVVLSQDCDILQRSLKKEPLIELIRANEIAQCDGNSTFGKNPRKLHLQSAEGNYHFELFPYERYFIPRHYLENLNADESVIDRSNLRILVNWINKRYRRDAFPDQFNLRIQSSIKKIKKIFSQEIMKKTYGLFVRLSSKEELKVNETYKVELVMLVPKDIYNKEQFLSEIDKNFDEILMILNDVEGIQILEGAQIQSTDEMTLHRYQQMKQLDFDYISFIGDEQGEIASDIV
jgi:hypothetical protein